MEKYFDRLEEGTSNCWKMEKNWRIGKLWNKRLLVVKYDKQIMIGDILKHNPEENLKFKTAGRIMSLRGKGKSLLLLI